VAGEAFSLKQSFREERSIRLTSVTRPSQSGAPGHLAHCSDFRRLCEPDSRRVCLSRLTFKVRAGFFTFGWISQRPRRFH